MGKAILTVCFGQGQNTRAEDIVLTSWTSATLTMPSLEEPH